MGDCVEYHLRYMKFSLSVLLALAGTLLSQAAVTVVSGNVYDVGKYSFCQDSGLEGDAPMCWAASAANIIQHWQDTYSDFADPGKTVPNGTQENNYIYPRGTGELKVYQQILQDWEMGSGVPYNAISLWMQGPTRSSGSMYGRYVGIGALQKNWLGDSGGYYKLLFGNVPSTSMPAYHSLTNAPFYSLQIDKINEYVQQHGAEPTDDPTLQLADVCATLTEAFKVQGQAVSLLVQPERGSGHAISCWGYETQKDAQGREVITSLILSDSDDGKFGTFIVNLTEGKDGSVTIQTDRYNSWYHGGDYTIKDVIYITTPETTPSDIGKHKAGDAVAQNRKAQASINAVAFISGVEHSGCLREAVDTKTHVTIGGGTYSETKDPEPVVFTTTDKASISIYDDSGTLLTVADGGMALLYGGLSLQGKEEREVQGAEVLGHLYIHGGKVDIEACHTTNTAGAALHGGVLDDMDGFFTTDGLFATSYIEVKNAEDVTIVNNSAASNLVDPDGKLIIFGGGAVSAEDSFSFRDNKSVSISKNSLEGIQGNFVYGGGAYARMEATLSGNVSLEMSDNAVKAVSSVVEGGALAAMFTNICENGKVSFSLNVAEALDGVSAYYPDPATGSYTLGANGRGGAIAVTFPSAIMSGSFYIPATLHLDGNNKVSFTQNITKAVLTDTLTNNAYASGGALYVGNLLEPKRDDPEAPPVPVCGAVASISNNTGGITFDGNQALADSYRLPERGGDANGVARGGAAFVAEKASLSIDSNKGGVTFSNNRAEGSATSQGGGIYNAGELAITNNDAVEFSNNTADEGSHIFNDEGGVAEIAWNGKVLFSGASAEDSTVVNKGEMYLAAGQGQKIQFHNTVLDTTQGTLTVGRDTAGAAHATTLTFTARVSADTPAARTAVSGLEADLSGLSLSAGIIVAGEGQNVYLNNVAVSTNTNLVVENMTLGTNVQLAESSAGHTLTLSNVDIDLSGASLTSTANDQGGKDYVFNLCGMLSGSVTMLNVTFDADALLGQDIDIINKDRVCMMFGDVTYFPEAMEKTTISMVGSGGTPVYCKVVDGGNVYFGEWFQVPEPTTGTLSLLALAALAARRRRK